MGNEKYASQEKYDAQNTRRFGVKLNRKTDADAIEKLESLDNMQGYIKGLIKADLELPRYIKEIEAQTLMGYALKEAGTKTVEDRDIRFAYMTKKSEKTGKEDTIRLEEHPDGSVYVRKL